MADGTPAPATGPAESSEPGADLAPAQLSAQVAALATAAAGAAPHELPSSTRAATVLVPGAPPAPLAALEPAVPDVATGRPAPGVGFRRPAGAESFATTGRAAAARLGAKIGARTPELSPGARLWLGRLITFHVVCLAWVFFRATSFHNAMEVLGRIATLGGRHQHFNWKVAAVIVGALAVQVGPRGVGPRLQVLYSRASFWVQAVLLATVLTAIDLLGPAGVAPFIYFRF